MGAQFITYDIVSGLGLVWTSTDIYPTTPSLIASDPNDPSFRFHPSGSRLLSNANAVLPSPQISLEAWVNGESSMTNNGIMGAWSSAGSMLYVATTIAFYTSGTSIVGPTLVLGATTYIVGTFDGTYRRLYINGLLAAGPTAGTVPEPNPAIPFQISGYGNVGGVYFDGTIDEPAVYNRALTDAEVWAHYQAAQF